ncbi:uncharacterized protein V1518DRAFT_379080 [Limtongia smithiae]|uniref:uncharacterized protein n=1 Tax=Limtongia smithiae TaxID=1125753 RepID=UPI0034CD9B94
MSSPESHRLLRATFMSKSLLTYVCPLLFLFALSSSRGVFALEDADGLATALTGSLSSATVVDTKPLTTNTMGIFSARSASAAPPGLLSKAIWFIPRLIIHVLALIAYHLPAQVLSLLGTSFSVTLSFSSLLLIMATFGAIVWAYVRYRYLNVYSRLPQESHRQEPQVGMMFFPNALPNHFEKPGFANYLDEFFSGFKIFGYLEKPVFHELTRHVQTRKLIAGDTMLLEEEKGFCIVVDGDIQIFANINAMSDHKSRHRDSYVDENDEESGYRLLTEVKNGAPLSSLFTILSLFTEHLDIRRHSSSVSSPMAARSEEALPMQSNYPGVGTTLLPLPQIPPLSEKVSSGPYGDDSHHGDPHSNDYRNSRSLEGIIARATVDSTIAIIPAEAFRRLTQKYPKSAAHIVQVILARFQRVTFQTGNNYLGLTSEILKTEIAFNELSRYELPNYLSQDAIARIKTYFGDLSGKNYDATFDEDSDRHGYFDDLKVPPMKPPSQYDIRRTASRSDFMNQRDRSMNSSKVLPGDLMSNGAMSGYNTSPLNFGANTVPARSSFDRHMSSKSPRSMYGTLDLSEADDNEDIGDNIKEVDAEEIAEFKRAILECILHALGITPDSIINKSPPNTSAETSPRISAFDSRRGSSRLPPMHTKNSVNTLLGFVNSPNLTFADDESVASSGLRQPASPHTSLASMKKILCKDVEVLHFKAGSRILKQGDPNKGLYYVIDGFLDVCSQNKSGEYKTIYTIKPGGIGGYLGSISGFRSFVDIRATTDAYIGFLSKDALERLIDSQPIVLLTMAKRLTTILSSLILHLDFALEWVQLEAGQVLYQQGDEADSMYIVLNGRIRAVKGDEGSMELVGEYGQNESIGELEVLTSSKRTATIHAVRDTELVRFPRTLFESLAMRHPEITMQISRIIASRVISLANNAAPTSGKFRTLAVLPVTSGLPCKEFASRLSRAFTTIGQANILLDQATVLKHLGKHSFNKFGKLKLSSYLTDLEERYQMVVYVGDTSVSSPWTQTCISQADCILLLADANADTAIGEYERMLLTTKTTARKELVLLHHDRYVPPGQTNGWLKHRIWIQSHHHVQMQFRVSPPRNPTALFGARIRNLKDKFQSTLQTELQKYTTRLSGSMPVYLSSQMHKDDFARLARILSGNAVGLVLGGGGARGLSHLGVIRALEEAGIPIDIVGGTSIGAFVGGLYARDSDIVPMYGRLKKFSGRVASLWRMFFDLTYPATSYTTGHEFNRGVWKAFGDSRIEDFWLRYYTNTTNITHSRMEIHAVGYAWRYIRASMSLAGLLPPVTDDGSMLLDGGYVDNLTVSHMKSLGADVVFAVDVGSVDDTTAMAWGDSLSGFWVLLNRFNIFSRQPNVPSMADIQARLAYVSSVGALERAKRMPGCVYMRPPIEGYGTLDFGKFDEIYGVGYQFAKAMLERLVGEGKFPKIAGVARLSDANRRPVQRRNSI